MVVIIAVEFDYNLARFIHQPELVEEAPLVACDEDCDLPYLLLLVQLYVLHLVVVTGKLRFKE